MMKHLTALLMVLTCALLAGCQSPAKTPIVPAAAERTEPLILRAGDVVKISFPGAPNLDATQQIWRDGHIAMPLVGEILVVGKTPKELEKEVLKLYGAQLVVKEVTVTVVSSSLPVFVTGAVLRPGKFMSERPITALEAIMEAGGFDYAKADMTDVRVIRHEDGKVKYFTLNLKLALQGKASEPFYLKASDIVYVPERFTWF